MSQILELQRVHLALGGTPILRDLNLSVTAGEIACLLGPSGCGKTTALRLIAGFDDLNQGLVHIHGQVVNRPGFTLPPEKRKVGIVFQDAALFPHLNVARNIAFGLRAMTGRRRRERVTELLETIGLVDLGTRFPHQLSGGQRQRVALARAMAPQPDLILLDEPFSNLDAGLRQSLGRELRAILKASGMTAILVTHDQNEAFAMADRIAVMNQGEILQYATATELYNRPQNRFVAEFIGDGVLIRGKVADGAIQCPLGPIPIEQDENLASGQTVDLLIRPDDLIHDPTSQLSGHIRDQQFRGSGSLFSLVLSDGTPILAYLRNTRFREGDTVPLRLNPTNPVLKFPIQN